MNCIKHNQDMINRHVDGELSPEEEKVLKEHIEKCGSCRQEYDNMKSVLSAIKNIHVPELDNSESLWTRIQDSITDSKEYNFFRSWFIIPVAVAAVILSMIIFSPDTQNSKDNNSLTVMDSYIIEQVTYFNQIIEQEGSQEEEKDLIDEFLYDET